MTKNVLDLKFYSNDLNKEITIRHFFYELMKTLWIQKESFNSKRPFDMSGWEYDVIICLVENGLVRGVVVDDCLTSYSREDVDNFVVHKILKPLFGIE